MRLSYLIILSSYYHHLIIIIIHHRCQLLATVHLDKVGACVGLPLCHCAAGVQWSLRRLSKDAAGGACVHQNRKSQEWEVKSWNPRSSNHQHRWRTDGVPSSVWRLHFLPRLCRIHIISSLFDGPWAFSMLSMIQCRISKSKHFFVDSDISWHLQWWPFDCTVAEAVCLRIPQYDTAQKHRGCNHADASLLTSDDKSFFYLSSPAHSNSSSKIL